MIKKILLTVAVIFTYISAYAGGDPEPAPVAVSQKYQIVDSLTNGYYDWDAISMSGKLSSPMLPLTASLKVYMEKDSLVVITVSAPLVGEAARIEIDPDRALVVNKLKNSYSIVEMNDIESICPGGIEAVQNLLLARVSVIGSGELSSGDCSNIEIYDAGEDLWMLLPNQEIETAPFVYYYVLDKNPLELDRFTVLAQDGDSQIDCFYTINERNTIINFITLVNGRNLEAQLQLNNPDTKVKPISRFELTSKYRQTDLKGILK